MVACVSLARLFGLIVYRPTLSTLSSTGAYLNLKFVALNTFALGLCPKLIALPERQGPRHFIFMTYRAPSATAPIAATLI